MFKVVMSVFSLAVLVFGLSLQAAEIQTSTEIPVQVLSVSFDSQKNSVDVLVTHKSGGCDAENYSLKLRGCTELIAPYKCFADLKGYSHKVCDKDTFVIVPFTVESLGLASKRFKNTTLIINGSDADKSQKKVILRKM
jgi:hypothetical protein